MSRAAKIPARPFPTGKVASCVLATVGVKSWPGRQMSALRPALWDGSAVVVDRGLWRGGKGVRELGLSRCALRWEITEEWRPRFSCALNATVRPIGSTEANSLPEQNQTSLLGWPLGQLGIKKYKKKAHQPKTKTKRPKTNKCTIDYAAKVTEVTARVAGDAVGTRRLGSSVRRGWENTFIERSPSRAQRGTRNHAGTYQITAPQRSVAAVAAAEPDAALAPSAGAAVAPALEARVPGAVLGA